MGAQEHEHRSIPVDALIPPEDLRGYVGVGDFLEIGREFLRYFVNLGGLKPDASVLDVGCGIGRMALSLTGYLDHSGSYRGFDIVEDGIRWCQQQITPRYPNFVFEIADVYNAFYNPYGRLQPEEYRFPFEDGAFDFVLVTSVFTHMLPRGTAHYLREIARVKKPGATSLNTFFLLNDESLAMIRAGRSSQPFAYPIDGCLTTEARTPESAVAYPEELVRRMYASCGLSIMDPIHYGSWCGRPRFLSYQDAIVAAQA